MLNTASVVSSWDMQFRYNYYNLLWGLHKSYKFIFGTSFGVLSMHDNMLTLSYQDKKCSISYQHNSKLLPSTKIF